MEAEQDLHSLFRIESAESTTPKAENREPTKADSIRYMVFKITGSKKFMITKDLFTPVWELTYNQRTFKGLEADIIKQLKQYQQLGVYQTVLIFI